MIVVRLSGGLGNQMFQYAAGRELANRHGVQLALDNRLFNTYKLHNYGLNQLQIRATLATEAQLSRWPNYLRVPFRLLQRLGIDSRFYFEPSFEYDSNWSFLGKDLLIEGYFQSEKYFNRIAKDIKNEFQPIKALSGINAQVVLDVKNPNSVMIHVRRGDYVTELKNLNKHGVCSIDYYQNAIDLMEGRLNRPKYFVFSNDFEWVKLNLKFRSEVVYVEGNNNSPEIDLYLMSLCSNHIIANSTFSWWGAWLSDNINKIVICPTPWFDSNDIVSRSLLPKEWIELKK